MKHWLVSFILFCMVGFWVAALQQSSEVIPGGTPGVTYLGEGGSYTVEPGLNFIVKQRPFAFELLPGPAYTAGARERVWATSAGGAPDAVYQTWVSFGEVTAGCVVEYQTIDDDPDDRINEFYVNDVAVHQLPQGMVANGSFMVQTSGTLKFYAADSTGIWVESCSDVVSPTPTETPSPTATDTPSPTMSPTAEATLTPTPTPSSTATISATTEATVTMTPSPTATFHVSTRVLTATPTPTVPPPTQPSPLDTPTPTPTREPRENACLRINFEVGGDEARRGLYVVQEVGGRILYSWWADTGWMDSGWVTDVDITFPAVYIQVFFYRGDGSAPVEMEIVNPAPGTPYGWLARGQCHALEIAWPD